MSHADEELAAAFLAEMKRQQGLKSHFQMTLLNPTFHWFFGQGLTALELELYIPGVSSLLNGIEASLRVTLHQIDPNYDGTFDLKAWDTLSNPLLRKGLAAGLPVEVLAFPGEDDFLIRLSTKDPVRLVQLRHNVCHGNIIEFIQEVEPELQILTPECLRPTAAILLDMSFKWAKALAEFRNAANPPRRPNNEPIPDIPANFLAEYLPA